MQGLPTNLLTQNVAQAAVKGDVKSPASVVNGEMVVATPGQTQTEGSGETKGSFASFFSNLIGGEEKKVEGKGEKVEKLPAQMAEEVKAQSSSEAKLDSLLKVKGQEQNQNKHIDQKTMTSAEALSPEVLKNIDSLLNKNPAAQKVEAEGVSAKITNTSTNLDQLLKTLKGEEDAGVEVNADGEVIEGQETKTSKGSALDFLLKQSKESDVGAVETKDTKLLKTNPEAVSKLGLSSEDFVSHMNVKDLKNAKGEKVLAKQGDAEIVNFDPKDLVGKQMNASMKSYGQKQNLLNDHLIKNTHDLAFKENKGKASADELKNSDMKIGAELAGIKEPLIQSMTNKQEQAPQMEAQNAGKVLDLSKMNTSNSTEIIKRISDYVQQSQVANQDSLDLTVKHDSLGQFKIQVNKPMGGAHSAPMDMQITTTTPEGHEFFVKNETGLLKNLSQAGIQLSDLRIVSSSESMGFTQSDSRQSNNSQFGNQAQREFMSFDSGDSSSGSQRRRELWQEARQNQQRYGA